MRTVSGLVLFSILSLCVAQESNTEGINEDLNTITKTSARFDPYIRKALLKALSELEESETTGTDDASTYGDDITETMAPEPTKETIQIHSYVVNGQAAFDNSTDNTPTLTDSNISILSTTVGNVENQLPSAQPTFSPFTEVLQAKATANIHQRSIASTTKAVVETLEKKTTYKPILKTTKSTTTTTTSTTTTTPKPTHNDDGENIEEVDKRDVQVFQAPLVAAFTVQQDEQGLPKRVIPIFQQTNNVDVLRPLSPNPVSNGIIPSQSFGIPAQPEIISQQLSLQKQLEEKQRFLEEQLRVLLLQQKQQEDLLRKQQFIIQQKDVLRQQPIFAEQSQSQRPLLPLQQSLPTANPANFQIQKSVSPNNFLNHNVGIHPSNNQVLIQSSVPLDQSTAVTNRQQLPNREAVDFLLQLRNHQSEQFPLQENHLPQGISTFLQPSAAPPVFHQGLALNQIRPSDQHKQNTRVFRHELGIGNFGLNNNQNYNRFTTFGPIYSNRFFPPNRQTQYNSDVELRQLLSQNVLNGRAHEDLNIVTKVLSLNHGLNNNISNRLPFDSRRHI